MNAVGRVKRPKANNAPPMSSIIPAIPDRLVAEVFAIEGIEGKPSHFAFRVVEGPIPQRCEGCSIHGSSKIRVSFWYCFPSGAHVRTQKAVGRSSGCQRRGFQTANRYVS